MLIQSGGGKSDPAEIDPEILAKIAADAGMKAGEAIQQELGSMSEKMMAKMDEIKGAVNAIASKLDLPPEPLVLAVLFGCNLCYATPIAYQTNMLIMSEGSYEFVDYIRTGVPLVALMVATLSILLVLSYGL